MTSVPDYDGLRFPRGLYGITPDTDDTAGLLAAIAAAARGGLRSLQWRRKQSASPEALLAQGQAIGRQCRELGLVFIVNDDWRMAQDLDADGVHLGRDDGDLQAARAALGQGRIIGVSCYADLARARALLAQGADYIAFGAVYPSPTKPQAARAPLELLMQARKLLDELPAPRPAMVAIGGIHAANAAPVVQAGADALAIIQGIFQADDIEAAARACAQAFA